MALVELVMSHEPYASATLVFWVVDNGSFHCGQAAINQSRWPSMGRSDWLSATDVDAPKPRRHGDLIRHPGQA